MTHTEPTTLRAVRTRLAAELEATAETLARDRAVRADLDALLFQPGSRIAILGDSLSADALGWPNLLKALLARHGRADLQIVNRSIAGRTTAEAIDAYAGTLQGHPTWILIMLGTNDARRHGHAGVRTASIRETERNLRALIEMGTREAVARTVLLTPTPIDDTRDGPRDGSDAYWNSADITEVAEAVLRIDADAIDLHSSIDTTDEFWQPDGTHPTATGQITVLRAVITELAERGRA